MSCGVPGGAVLTRSFGTCVFSAPHPTITACTKKRSLQSPSPRSSSDGTALTAHPHLLWIDIRVDNHWNITSKSRGKTSRIAFETTKLDVTACLMVQGRRCLQIYAVMWLWCFSRQPAVVGKWYVRGIFFKHFSYVGGRPSAWELLRSYFCSLYLQKALLVY